MCGIVGVQRKHIQAKMKLFCNEIGGLSRDFFQPTTNVVFNLITNLEGAMNLIIQI